MKRGHVNRDRKENRFFFGEVLLVFLLFSHSKYTVLAVALARGESNLVTTVRPKTIIYGKKSDLFFYCVQRLQEQAAVNLMV